MTIASPDSQLVSAYAAEGSEPAFRALVARYVNLVYATALRQAGDSGMAEEITQNVFMALARKAPRLAGIETLAGWLHRTAILESKARIRSELRRRQREETAAAMGALELEGTSPLDPLLPLLDEALLHLRENDRLALVLRFLEERSLHDVGVALGVEEDAARKRVTRALERLAEFFKRKGFAVPAGASLFANAAQSAPATVAASAAQAGIQAGGAATGLNLLLFHFMNLSKTKLVAICALLAVVPILSQMRVAGALAQQRVNISAEIIAARQRADSLEAETRRVSKATLDAQTETANLQLRLQDLTAQRDGRKSHSAYQWNDASNLVRMPKSLLKNIRRQTLTNRRGQLDGVMKTLLQMTDAEAEKTQAAVDHFLASYYASETPGLHSVPATKKDLQGHTPEQTRVFEIPFIGEDKLDELRDEFYGEVKATLGEDRFAVFRSGLAGWMPVDKDYNGMCGGMAIFSYEQRVSVYQPKPGDHQLRCNVTGSSLNGSSFAMGDFMALDDVPEILQNQLQDWIALAQSQPATQ